jgi:alanyl-tRNA synthetase
MLGDAYPEIAAEPGAIVQVIRDEARKFERTLAHGLRVLEKRTAIDAGVAFDLFQTHGFPFELTRELAEGRRGVIDERGLAPGGSAAEGRGGLDDERGLAPVGSAAEGRGGLGLIDEAGFRAELERHRDRSRPTSGATFEGGLADHSAEIVALHTVTHLLQAALREVLGPHVIQRGSNITHERLRFDFAHGQKLAPEQLERVQARVNGWLARDLVVERASMSEASARALGAIGAFGESYGEIVSTYAITDRATGEVVSREFCGGPHLRSLDQLAGRRLQIVREHAIAAGTRRIKAVLV